jgi:heme exporter protein D
VSEFLEMGGYAAFVWPAFFVTLGLMVLLAVLSGRAHAASERNLAALETTVRRGDQAGDGDGGDEA